MHCDNSVARCTFMVTYRATKKNSNVPGLDFLNKLLPEHRLTFYNWPLILVVCTGEVQGLY